MFKMKRMREYAQFLSVAFISSTFLTSAYGIMTDDDRQNHNWSVLFSKTQLSSNIFKHFDPRSLARTAQVSKNSQHLINQIRHDRLDDEKQQLHPLILEVTNAEPNEVQRAHDCLEDYLKTNKAREEQEFLKSLEDLKARLLQPESLVRSNETLFNQLLTASELSDAHPALKPLVKLIDDLGQIIPLITQDLYLKKVIICLKKHYETYLSHLFSPQCDRSRHLQPKALLSGEGFLGYNQGYTSYRITQEMARSLLSKDEYGLLARTNNQGNHAVSFKRSLYNPTRGVHFKGDTAMTGLYVGRESAVYALSQILFNRGASVSSLLTLNKVEINTPLEGTAAFAAFNEALKQEQTSEDFFTQYPGYERQFTKKEPSHVLQASFHIEGMTLEDFIAGIDSKIYSYDDLDLTTFSEQILLSALINPSDGTPGNFMVRTDLGKPYAIIGIDNDMALEVGDVFAEKVFPKPTQRGIGVTKKHNIRVKNILMCLPLMTKALSPSMVKRLLTLNPECVALEWLEFLRHYEGRYHVLQQGKYSLDQHDQTTQTYLSEAHYEGLQLPFRLDPDFIPQFCQNIRNIQTYLAHHFAADHWQLLLNIHPLSSRFYQEMVKQAKGSPIGAYLKIDNRYRKYNPVRDVTYLEDALSLEEKLWSWLSIGETIKLIKARPDGLQSMTQTIGDAAAVLLSQLNVSEQSCGFLRSAISGFEHIILNKDTSLFPSLHESWYKNELLLKALSDGESIKTIEIFLKLGLDVSVTDKQGRTALRHAAHRHDPVSFLYLLKKYYQGDQLANWLNRQANDHLTALDVALKEQQSQAFKELIDYGASTCDPQNALAFYKNIIKTTKDSSIRNAFHKLMKINDGVRWQVCLQEMLPPDEDGQHGTPLLTAKALTRRLPNWVKSQILDNNNQWIPYIPIQDGQRIVCRATLPQTAEKPEQALYFKVYPELPGIEEAVGLLTHMILGYGAPHTELTNIKGCPVLISHSHGEKQKTLKHILSHNPRILKDQGEKSLLDPESLSGLILVSMLINPEDGKSANYVIEEHPTKPGKYRIVGIDNDHALVPAVVRKKPEHELLGLSSKPIPVAQVKTILYCLDQMKNPVHPTIRDLFTKLDPAELLQRWLKELEKVGESYNNLFSDPDEQINFFNIHGSFIGIPFQQGAIAHLYDKFMIIRNYLSKNPDITHMDLLMKCEPHLGKKYQAVMHLSSAQERWNTVDGIFYEKTKDGKEITLTPGGHILKAMDIPLEASVLESIRKAQSLSPTQALEELKAIKRELETHALEAIGARKGDRNIFKTLQLEFTRAKFLEDTDFKDLDPQEQEAVLSYLKGKQLREAKFRNCTALNDPWLIQGLTLSHLLKLDLTGCEAVTYRSLLHLSKTASALEELKLLNIKSLTEVGNIGVFTDAPLLFKELLSLNLSGCVNLKKLLLKAPKLLYLNIEDCALLTDQMLDGVIEGSEKLKTLQLKGAGKISKGDLREMYPAGILKDLKLNKDELFALAEQYYSGKEVPQDYEKALKFYRLAATQGAREYNLAKMYQDDQLVHPDYGKAEYNLGRMYLSGTGVKQDYLEAEKWYQKAADKGNTEAENEILLIMYERSLVTTQVLETSLKKFRHLHRFLERHPNLNFNLEYLSFYSKKIYPLLSEKSLEVLYRSSLPGVLSYMAQYGLGGDGDYYFGPQAGFEFTYEIYDRFLSLLNEPDRSSLMFLFILSGPVYEQLNLKIRTFCCSPSRIKIPYFDYESAKCIGEVFVKYYKNLMYIELGWFGELTPKGAATFRQFIPYMKNIRKFEVGGTDLVHDTQFDHLIPEVLIDEEFLKSL